jgi:hypothetical protein
MEEEFSLFYKIRWEIIHFLGNILNSFFIKTARLELFIVEITNPFPKLKRNEYADSYIKRLSPKQAVAYTRYWLYVATLNANNARLYEGYKYESKKLTKAFDEMCKNLIKAEEFWKTLFGESLKRKNLEKN